MKSRDRAKQNEGEEQVKKIALIGARLSTNLGGPSLLAATRMVLSDVFPEAEYTLFVPERDFPRDRGLASKYGVKVLPFSLPKFCHALLVASMTPFSSRIAMCAERELNTVLARGSFNPDRFLSGMH